MVFYFGFKVLAVWIRIFRAVNMMCAAADPLSKAAIIHFQIQSSTRLGSPG